MVDGIEGFLIDLDGTVYRGNRLIDGAADAIRLLEREGKRFVFVSNRGNLSRAMCRDKLARMGLEVPAESILLTSTVTGMYLRDRHPGCRVWVLGEEGLTRELASFGIPHASRPEDADWLVITLHETVTYRDLNLAFRAVRGGARIIATNADRMVPTEEGDCLDVAGMIGAIAYSTGKEPEVVVGKPSAIMAETALRLIGLPPGKCMVIGDSLGSDIAMAGRGGMASALVLTGSATRQDADQGEYRPDVVWDSIADLMKVWK
ncbi:HAD-IIA family hydrolase [Cohnella caldifontis]|uniref:HAD-IIA family hydrolase n=1 Tax=Cohnella caldifontis TaxID=3027471 RepID=UPI0023EB6F6D|nr:HAD-IIA family hydrolase [Cohnella sp. YIM B05605]